MTEEQIVKAWECCFSCRDTDCCDKCPLCDLDFEVCVETLLKESKDLLSRRNEQIEALISGQETLQKHIAEKDAEVERLQGRNKRLESAFVAECDLSACPRKQEIKNEAIKDALNRAKKRIGDSHFQNYGLAIMEIMEVEKEMVGDE